MPRRSPEPSSLEEIAARLRITREALGHTQVMMAKLMGSATNGQAWENYEAGRRMISIRHALALTQSCRLTLEWLYQGQAHNLPPDIRQEIERLMVRRDQPTTRKSRSS